MSPKSRSFIFMTVEEISDAILEMQRDLSTPWEEKLLALLAKSQGSDELEAIGQSVNSKQLKVVMLFLARNPEQLVSKLPPLLVGVGPQLFRELIQIGSREIQEALKTAANTEPLQHHVTILVHEIQNLLASFYQDYEMLEQHLNLFELGPTNQKELFNALDQVDEERKNAELVMGQINTLLGITWMTGRVDLIDNLNSLKVSLKRLIKDGLGSQETHTGLFEIIHQKLESVFGNPNDPQEKEAIHDQDPALEALAKLSIWYLEDYFGLGLLPSLSSPSQVHLDPKSHSELECLKHREKLFNEARQSLRKKGLNKVKDLKAKGIYSKEALIDFLSSDQTKE